MGVKDLWALLTPYCERKPLYELQGKVVAIDLAGWVCESLNVVDYFVHPKQYLKNLFFRTCYLLLSGVTPVFVLDGKAPELKQDTITKRNGLQFRGNKPRDESSQSGQTNNAATKSKKGRTRFNYVLKECENLLRTMGLQCIQAPGEAEAFCAHMNMNGHVYGIISQDSDCFAYGAKRVFRNFSVSTQGNSAASGGAVDVYDMEKICNAMDFGQNKIVAMALLCGCDYCPGVDGIGRDAVIKLFAKYKNNEILERIKSWRAYEHKYTELEMKVDNKNICANCGHCGRTLAHAKSGCHLCKTSHGCDPSLWKEERLALKAELAMRKKALMKPDFPSEEIIEEFLARPINLPKLDLRWNQPNLVRFVKVIGLSLQWTEIYCFQKILPLLTRWSIFNFKENDDVSQKQVLRPDFIRKKRAPKGVPSYEIVWKDNQDQLGGLIPDDQLQSYVHENPKGIETLFTTIEPIEAVDKAFPGVVEQFLLKQKKPKATKKKTTADKKPSAEKMNDSLNNFSDFLKATEEIEKGLKKHTKKNKETLTKIDKFLIHKSSPIRYAKLGKTCSTPKAKKTICLLDLEDDEDDFNFSEIIEDIVSKPSLLKKLDGQQLKYESIKYLNRSQDDLDLLPQMKRKLLSDSPFKPSKRSFLSGACDSLAKLHASQDDLNISGNKAVDCIISRFLAREGIAACEKSKEDANTSYFFDRSIRGVDEFERSLDMHLNIQDNVNCDDYDDCFLID